MAKKDDYTYQQKQDEPYAKVILGGENRKSFQPKDTWELDLTDFIGSVDPNDYFVTSGEATLKARKLEADLFQAAGRARKLVNTLKKLKDTNVYLESSWHDGRLILKAKNPRKNREDKLKALEENFEHGEKVN